MLSWISRRLSVQCSNSVSNPCKRMAHSGPVLSLTSSGAMLAPSLATAISAKSLRRSTLFSVSKICESSHAFWSSMVWRRFTCGGDTFSSSSPARSLSIKFSTSCFSMLSAGGTGSPTAGPLLSTFGLFDLTGYPGLFDLTRGSGFNPEPGWASPNQLMMPDFVAPVWGIFRLSGSVDGSPGEATCLVLDGGGETVFALRDLERLRSCPFLGDSSRSASP
mmetsp:Transcript_123515/g.238145  ORF Transcript_123515/g.238145 Transcript_123515/m.238145 type:complete len:220 (-) Transcript_123515:119-778(-)